MNIVNNSEWDSLKQSVQTEIADLNDESIKTGDIVKALTQNDFIEKMKDSAQICVCNCDYCTCDCNFCSCNCDYCTCNCNY